MTVEDSGAAAPFRMASGSAAVATITYLILQWEPPQLKFFIYPEVMFAVAALEILPGHYTGEGCLH